MAVRRLHPDQPSAFAFTPANREWAATTIKKYPAGKQASAVIPLLWRAQEQEGWVTDPAIRGVAVMLDMAYIRVLEVATFYTMFQLAPTGSKAHIQVCGTTPCMLRGAGQLIDACKRRIHPQPLHLSADGALSWEEVECLGACVNAPMIMVGSDTWEDLDADRFERVLDGFANGKPVAKGPQVLRQLSAPEGGATTLTDPTLADGSRLGGWLQAFEDRVAGARAKAEAAATAVAVAAVAGPASAPAVAAPSAALAPALAVTTPRNGAAANVTTLLNNRPEPAVAAAPALILASVALAGAGSVGTSSVGAPPLLTQPRNGKGDDLTLIWGVAETMQNRMYGMGIWHFDQIAAWTPANIAWFEAQVEDYSGRLERDNWIKQARDLAGGWRPGNKVGERPQS